MNKIYITGLFTKLNNSHINVSKNLHKNKFYNIKNILNLYFNMHSKQIEIFNTNNCEDTDCTKRFGNQIYHYTCNNNVKYDEISEKIYLSNVY